MTLPKPFGLTCIRESMYCDVLCIVNIESVHHTYESFITENKK